MNATTNFNILPDAKNLDLKTIWRLLKAKFLFLTIAFFRKKIILVSSFDI